MVGRRLGLAGVAVVIGIGLGLGACNKGSSRGGGGGPGMVVDQVGSVLDAVSLGERMAQVTMQIRNPGGGNLIITDAQLQMLLGPADVTQEYIIKPAPGNPNAVAPGGTETLTFFVDVRASATPGIITLTGTALGLGVGQRTAVATDTWDLREVVVRSIHPPGGAAQGSVLKIHGHNFSNAAGQNTVLLDGTPTGIVYADHHLIRATVPATQPVGAVTVEVMVNGESSVPFAYDIIAGGGVSWVVEAEPNGSFGTANSFSLDMGEVDIQSALIDPAGDLDYYRITYNRAGFPVDARVELDIEADVQGSALDSILTAYDQGQVQITWNDDSGSLDSLISMDLPTQGEFYVRVEDYSGAGGPGFFYDLNISVTTPGSLFYLTWSDPTVPGYGVSMGDITGDLLPEILGERVAVNQGDGTYVAGFTLGAGAHSVTFGDVDNDGDNDLFVSMHGVSSNIFYRNDGYPNLVDVTVGAGLPTGGEIFIGLFVDYNNDGWLDICMIDDWVVEIYENDGTGAAFTLRTGIGLDNIIMTGHCSSAAFGDYDNDGDQDLFIVREEGNTDILLEYDAVQGTYLDVTTAAGVAGPIINLDDGYSVEWGDMNNDGWLDIYVANYTNFLPNYYYENLQNGAFSSLDQGNVQTPTFDNDGSIADFNNDGWLDILVSDQLYINLDGTGFREVSAGYGLGAASDWMAALGDTQGDGTVEIFDSQKLYTNQGTGLNWLELVLVGGAPSPGMSNRSAIGARVKVIAGALSMIREVNGGSGYVGQHDMVVHFGLGLEVVVGEIEIQWPSGVVQTLTNVSPNQRLVVNEG